MKIVDDDFVLLEMHEYNDIKQQLKELKNEIDKLNTHAHGIDPNWPSTTSEPRYDEQLREAPTTRLP